MNETNPNPNQETAVVTTAPLGAGKAITTKAGKITGFKYGFTGDMSAREIKEHFRLAGLKGRALTEKVNESLRSGEAQAEVKLAAALALLRQRRMIPDVATIRENSASIGFTKLAAIKPTKAETRAKQAEAKVSALTDALGKLRAMLEAKGLTADEIAAVVPA